MALVCDDTEEDTVNDKHRVDVGTLYTKNKRSSNNVVQKFR